jgi:hypothetical protein
MNTFFFVAGDQQADGLTRLTRYQNYADALTEARRMAQRFPDQCFYVAEAVVMAVCPAPTVETYNLRTSVREVA